MRRIFQKWLLVFIAAAFALTLILSFWIQTDQARRNAYELLRIRIQDTQKQLQRNENHLMAIRAATRAEVLTKAEALATLVEHAPELVDEGQELAVLLEKLDVDEIHLINREGVITRSSQPEVVGYEMASAEQSRPFMELAEGRRRTLVQEPRERGFGDRMVQYAGVGLAGGGLVQVGYSPKRLFQAMKLADVGQMAKGLRVGKGGGILIRDGGGKVLGATEGVVVEGALLAAEIPLWDGGEEEPFRARVGGARLLCLSSRAGERVITGFIPENEMFADRGFLLLFFTASHVLLFLVVFVLVSALVQRVVIEGIEGVNESLAKITRGDLEERVRVETNAEFRSLSEGINSMVASWKSAIAEAAARLDAELATAKAIQLSALPEAEVVGSGRRDFLLAAGMWTAKEVGGDFYDFFLMDEKHLGLLVADVSGKGIPAALFMMRAKTLIQDIAGTRMDPADILTQANERLCRNNEEGLFVTVWLGVVDLEGGVMRYANAGHNPPLLRRGEGGYEFLRNRPTGLVLAGLEGTRYERFEIRLGRGDRLFLYTDGVTEATNGRQELYGEGRLRERLGEVGDAAPREQLEALHEDLAAFVGPVDQFDDMTMVSFLFLGPLIREETFRAEVGRIEAVTAFVNGVLGEAGCAVGLRHQFDIVVDEIFSNIARYSGAREARVACGAEKGFMVLRFTDEGRPFNPLDRPSPDTTLPLEARVPGGLGIHIVRKLMDEVAYAHVGGRNILTLKKRMV